MRGKCKETRLIGSEGVRGTGMVADVLRKVTGARSCGVLQSIVMTLAFVLCEMRSHSKILNRRVRII